MKPTLGQWLEKLCAQSALLLLLGCAVRVLLLEPCQRLQGLSVRPVGGGQPCVPAVLTLPLLCESTHCTLAQRRREQRNRSLAFRAGVNKLRRGACVWWHRSFPWQLTVTSWRKNTKLKQLVLIA